MAAKQAELNTPEFRAEVADVLKRNAEFNKVGHREPGDRGYRIATHADIAKHFGMKNSRGIDKILGPSKADSKPVKLTQKTPLIPQIRELLGIAHTSIWVPEERAEVLLEIASLPDGEFASYRDALKMRKRSA